jgi:predicted deacylase
MGEASTKTKTAMTNKKIDLSVLSRAVRHLTRRQWAFIGGAFGVMTMIIYMVVFFDKAITFSYAGQTCIKRTVLFPGLFRTTDSEGYSLQLSDSKKLGDTVLSSNAICVYAKRTPEKASETVSVSLFGTFLMRQQLIVSADTPPEVNTARLARPVPTHVPLTLPLSKADKVHRYYVQAGDDRAACQTMDTVLKCDIASLKLKQGSDYVLSLKRQFPGNDIVQLVEKPIKTLSAVSVTSSTIARDELVYSVPTSLELTFDKKIAKKGEVVLERIEGDKRTAVAQHAVLSATGLSIVLDEPLPRSASHELRLSGFVAEDGSTLYENTYLHPFRTSGGPQVTRVSIGKSGVATGAAVVITFDQNLSPTQDIAPLVSFKGGSATISKRANQIIVQLGGLPACTDFSIALTSSIQSAYGVSGNSAWNINSRTICHTVFTIGHTVQGRAIMAYRFGSGASAILYLGLTHGNEMSSYTLLSQWIDELEANARNIPADKTIIVIPALNRDGLASGSRRNANNVDLNRNFPTGDWKPDVTMPGGQMVQGGGGSAPLSEPESSAIASYTQQLAPRLVLTYHSVAGLVTPNEAGISSVYATTYSSISGYYVSPKASAGEVFDYDTTGAYEDWLYEKPAIAAILVELGSNSSPQTSRNFPAMWAMMK